MVFLCLCSDRTLKVWSLDGLLNDTEEVFNLKAKAVVAAHDKDINSLAVAPNDSLVCSGSQVRSYLSTFIISHTSIGVWLSSHNFLS